MAKFVPSQIRSLLDDRFGFARAQLTGGPVSLVSPDYAGTLLQLLEMLEELPRDLPTLTPAARAELGEAIHTVRAITSAWSSGDRTQALGPMVARNGWSPLTFIRKHMEGLEDEMPETASKTSSDGPDPRVVFVVHGRNVAASRATFAFLRALGLRPLEWDQAVSLTGNASPYVLDVIKAGFARAQAIVVLFTPDDLAHLHPNLRGASELQERPSGQPRPNVLLEAGMALERDRARTVIVEFGDLRGLSDLQGIHDVRIAKGLALESRKRLATRLADAGCDVDTGGVDWLTTGDFDAAFIQDPASPSSGAVVEPTRVRAVALKKSVQRALADPTARYFDPRSVVPFFERYQTLRQVLAGSAVEFAELVEHGTPKPSGTTEFGGRGYVVRGELELLLSELEYCVDLLGTDGDGMAG